MAIRTPLKIVSGNLQEMSSTDTTNIISRMVYKYFTDPSVTLTSVASNGTAKFDMNDTRTQASAATSHASSFQTAGAVSTINVTNDKIIEALEHEDTVVDTNNIRFPVWNNSGNIQAMSLTDMYDSFVSVTNGASTLIPAAQPYKIDTSVSNGGVSGYTLVNAYPVFIDTIANVSAYSASGIPETRDQPTNQQPYYLHRNLGTEVTAPTPLYIDSNQNLKEYTAEEFDAILLTIIRYTSEYLTNNKLRFYINGTGTTCGTGILNKKYNSSSQQQVQVGDDYRTQRFPAGSLATENTYYLKARKE